MKKLQLNVAAVATAGLVALGGVAAVNAYAAPKDSGKDQGEKKVWVCKYVQKPGEAEVLKGGKNPIWVNWHAADKDKDGKVAVGDRFADAQELSIVIQIGGEDPGISACPVPGKPSTPAPTPTDEESTPAATPTDTESTPESTPPNCECPSDTETPGTETPGTETPGTETPGTETPGTETPGTETPGTETPGTTNPEKPLPNTGN